MQSILDKLKNTPGKIGFWFCDLTTGEKVSYAPDQPMIAASIIKIPIMIEAFRRFENRSLDPSAEYTLREEDKMPSCGILNRMHNGVRVTMRDLVEMMIVLSDNSATNILIDILGIENINAALRSFGITSSVLRRKLFDMAGWHAGISNHITAGDIGLLLEKMYRGELVSPKADAEMISILKEQRLNSKFPFFLEPRGILCAHKTGEDDNITHDVGIIYTARPFVLCMVSNDTDVPSFERLMQDTALELALRQS